jgi:hypothetical protein
MADLSLSKVEPAHPNQPKRDRRQKSGKIPSAKEPNIPWRGQLRVRSGVLIVNFLMLVMLFYNGPLLLPKARDADREGAEIPAEAPGLLKLIELEHNKAVTEIQMRIGQGNDWYRVKFTMIGGIVVALLTILGITAAKKEPASTKEKGYVGERALSDMASSKAVCLAVALATMVAIMIDMQNRQSDTMTKQLGLWIANYVEPALHPPPQIENQPGPRRFIGWETFLRPTGDLLKNTEAEGGHGGGLQNSAIYALTTLIFGHLPTCGLYLLYIVILQNISIRPATHVPIARFDLRITSFIGVHMLLIMFGFVAHMAPGTFFFEITGFPDVKGDVFGWFFLIPGTVLLINTIYLRRPKKEADAERISRKLRPRRLSKNQATSQ